MLFIECCFVCVQYSTVIAVGFWVARYSLYCNIFLLCVRSAQRAELVVYVWSVRLCPGWKYACLSCESFATRRCTTSTREANRE